MIGHQMQPKGPALAEALRSCRAAFGGVGFVSLVINALMLTGPLFMLQIYDRVLTSRSVPTLLALAGIVLGLYAFFGVLEALRTRILGRIGAGLDTRLSGVTFERSVALPLLGGRRAERLEPMRDLDTVRQFLSGSGPSAFFDMPWMPLYLGLVFLFHPLLGFIATGGALVMCVLIGLNEVLSRKPMAEAAAQSLRRNALVEGARANAEAASAMGMVAGLRARWLAENEAFLALQGKAADRTAVLGSMIKTFRFVLQSAILGFGAYLAIGDAITPGIMIATSIITSRAVAPIEQAVGQWRGFLGARQALARLKQVLGSARQAEPEVELPLPTQNVEVAGAFVTAPGMTAPIVQNVNFQLKAGEALGIIGSSGSGKSSLGRALVGVWPLAKGIVRLDGSDLYHWEPERLGRSIGYLPQDVQLFAGTVAENIARFQPDWKTEDVIKAATLANAHDLISRLPEGYDTQVGEDGAVLSGGQRQRIALARALYGDPFLVVLDEPNSNLDAEGEAALTDALRRMRKAGCAVVVIAHRPSAIAAVDSLMCLADGQVGAYGPKDEVLKTVLARNVREGVGLKVVNEG
ncbi:type I secretion system permease/ATPase [Pelagibius sp.]|uniref:type I secretion system permease/ATPase n=1 Tax=Pelagibius sp. TaxID=1931238 RepID=UPI003B50A367